MNVCIEETSLSTMNEDVKVHQESLDEDFSVAETSNPSKENKNINQENAAAFLPTSNLNSMKTFCKKVSLKIIWWFRCYLSKVAEYKKKFLFTKFLN